MASASSAVISTIEGDNQTALRMRNNAYNGHVVESVSGYFKGTVSTVEKKGAGDGALITAAAFVEASHTHSLIT